LDLVESFHAANMVPQIPTGEQVHYQVEVVSILEGKHDIADEGVLQLCQ
jgi:hypothetical protein